MAENLTTFELLARIIQQHLPELSFNLLEVGARPLAGEKEPLYQLLDWFPASRLTAFEVDGSICQQLNEDTPDNVTYYPVGLGLEDAEQTLYVTQAPMCTSLYKPNHALLEKYFGLEVAMLKEEVTVPVRGLDSFSQEYGIDQIDFIKIDIQGAELDVFRGGKKAMARTMMIVSEVEFIPLYEHQPLFGDVCQELGNDGFMFHKFLGISSRTLKPVKIRNDINQGTQNMWSDAVFVRSLEKLESSDPESLLKLALLTMLYNSPDLSVYCTRLYDSLQGTDLNLRFSRALSMA